MSKIVLRPSPVGKTIGTDKVATVVPLIGLAEVVFGFPEVVLGFSEVVLGFLEVVFGSLVDSGFLEVFSTVFVTMTVELLIESPVQCSMKQFLFEYSTPVLPALNS